MNNDTEQYTLYLYHYILLEDVTQADMILNNTISIYYIE